MGIFWEKLSFQPVCSMESSTVVASARGLYVPRPSVALLAVTLECQSFGLGRGALRDLLSQRPVTNPGDPEEKRAL